MKVWNSKATIAAGVLASLCMTAAPALADDHYDEGTRRDGLLIGVGLGAGHMQCEGEGCDGVTEAGGLNVQLGAMITDRFAIVGDLWAMGHTEDRLTVSQSMATLGPQFWLFDALWLRAGVGLARAAFNYDAEIVDIGDETELVPAAMAAVGLELLHTDDFALDAQLRFGSGFFNDEDTQIQNISVGVGANWY